MNYFSDMILSQISIHHKIKPKNETEKTLDQKLALHEKHGLNVFVFFASMFLIQISRCLQVNLSHYLQRTKCRFR